MRTYKAALLWMLLVSAIPLGNTSASPVESVSVTVTGAQGEIPESVGRRISASIEAIGGRVLIGKEEGLFRSNQNTYDKILSDIVNRVVVGYVVSDLQASYGTHTDIKVQLQPIGRIVEHVETVIDYGNLSPLARRLVEKDVMGVSEKMAALLIGLPVDSVGWAESVSQSAGREVLAQNLPEFEAGFDVTGGEHTVIRISLIPQGEIVRRAFISFRDTTIPRVLLFRVVNETEAMLRELEGLPVSFVYRHRDDIEKEMKYTLSENGFVQKYGIEIRTELRSGRETELKVDALTDHWLIRTEAWFDVGRDGNKNTAFDAVLGHFAGGNNLFFGEARFYPGPVEWNVFGGYAHRFGKSFDLGYKFDFVNKAGHIFGAKRFGDRFAIRMDRDMKLKANEYALSYRLHNYLALEYVYHTKDGKWLRLIANL